MFKLVWLERATSCACALEAEGPLASFAPRASWNEDIVLYTDQVLSRRQAQMRVFLNDVSLIQ